MVALKDSDRTLLTEGSRGCFKFPPPLALSIITKQLLQDAGTCTTEEGGDSIGAARSIFGEI